MLSRMIIAVCFLLGTSSVAMAQVKLEHKFIEGSTFTKETTHKIEQKLVIAGMDTDSKVDNRTIVKVTIGKRDANGTLRVQEKVESMQISMDSMGVNYTFDSNNPDSTTTSPLEFLRGVHKALSQRTSTTVVDKNNRVSAIESDRNLIDMLPNEVQQLVKSQVDPENLKKAANEELDQLPSQPVKQGDSWERKELANFGAGQVMTFHTTYTYEGTVEKDGRTLDKITAKVTGVEFALQDTPLPLALKGSNLKAEETVATTLFDRQTGRAVEGNSTIRITGDILFSANGMDLPSKLDLKMQTSSTTR